MWGSHSLVVYFWALEILDWCKFWSSGNTSNRGKKEFYILQFGNQNFDQLLHYTWCRKQITLAWSPELEKTFEHNYELLTDVFNYFTCSDYVDPESRQRPHVLRTFDYCWCDKDARAQLDNVSSRAGTLIFHFWI